MDNSPLIVSDACAERLQKTVAKSMTVKEVADVFGVSKDTILNCIKRTMPNLLQHGKTTFLNETQVACISKELKSNKVVTDRLTVEVSSTVKNSTTDLEILENYKKANADFVALLERKYEEEKQKRELAEKSLNRIADGKGCFSMNQAAKALKLPYGNITLYKKLRAESILNSDNTPKQEQVNNGNFKVVVKFINEKLGNKPVTLVTSKGIIYLAKKLNTDIDSTVEADC